MFSASLVTSFQLSPIYCPLSDLCVGETVNAPALSSLSLGRDVTGRWLSSQELYPPALPTSRCGHVTSSHQWNKRLMSPSRWFLKSNMHLPCSRTPTWMGGFCRFRDWQSHKIQGAWIWGPLHKVKLQPMMIICNGLNMRKLGTDVFEVIYYSICLASL